jgi:hypothetical protein
MSVRAVRLTLGPASRSVNPLMSLLDSELPLGCMILRIESQLEV